MIKRSRTIDAAIAVRRCWLVVPMVLVAACHRPAAPLAAEAPSVRTQDTSPDRVESFGGVRGRSCEDQAGRFAVRGLWRDNLANGARDVLLAWTAHYSPKHQQCDILIRHRLKFDDVEFVSSELWDAFDATPLAAWTDDSRSSVRDAACRVDASDDPIVSCLAAKYFIDDHMRR